MLFTVPIMENIEFCNWISEMQGRTSGSLHTRNHTIFLAGKMELAIW